MTLMTQCAVSAAHSGGGAVDVSHRHEPTPNNEREPGDRMRPAKGVTLAGAPGVPAPDRSRERLDLGVAGLAETDRTPSGWERRPTDAAFDGVPTSGYRSPGQARISAR